MNGRVVVDEGSSGRIMNRAFAAILVTAILVVPVLFIATPAPVSASAADWNVTDLGMDPPIDQTSPNSINNQGQIAASAMEKDFPTGLMAVVYDSAQGGWIKLPLFGPSSIFSEALGINDGGEIVGYIEETAFNDIGAYWPSSVSTVAIKLLPLPGDSWSWASALNNAHIAVGTSYGSGADHAVQWVLDSSASEIAAEEIASFTSSQVAIADMNENGAFVGYHSGPDALAQAFYCAGPGQSVQTLAPLSGHPKSFANAVSDNGLIVGECVDSNDINSHAVVWTSPSANPIDLGFGVVGGNYAIDVNADNTILGHAQWGSPSTCVVYHNYPNGPVEILEGSPETDEAYLCNINDLGQIASMARISSGTDADWHTFLWTPNAPPVASFAFDWLSGTGTTLTASFDASASTDPDGTVADYAWAFGDGTAGSGKTVEHTYDTYGIYSVTLVVTDDRGLKDSTSQDIVAIGPTAVFTCVGVSASQNTLTASFDAVASTDVVGTIVDYTWNFGDGAIGSGMTIDHTFATPGIYTVTLVVTDDLGLTDSTLQVIDTSGPVAMFTYDWASATGTLMARFDASASTPVMGTIVNYAWDFGDGTVGSGMIVYHTYASSTTPYTVTLTITDNLGLTNQAQQTVLATSVQAFSDEIADLEDAIFACSADDSVKQDLAADAEKAEQQYILGARKSHGGDTAAATLLGMVTKIEGYTMANDINPGDGWKLTCMADLLIALLCNQVTTKGVPTYEWYHGCGPTAVGMIVGYWDTMRFNDLVPWDTSGQNSDVNSMIASAEHIKDYALFPDGFEWRSDSQSSLIADASEGALGRTPHTDNCIADFMHTSFSKDVCGWGDGLAKYIASGFMDYVSYASPHLDGTTTDKYTPTAKEVTGRSLSWSYVTKQLKQRPMAFLIDMNGDHKLDHLATAIGYCSIGKSKLYAFYSTWDDTIWWANFELMSQTTFFGIYGIYEFNIVQSSG